MESSADKQIHSDEEENQKIVDHERFKKQHSYTYWV